MVFELRAEMADSIFGRKEIERNWRCVSGADHEGSHEIIRFQLIKL